MKYLHALLIFAFLFVFCNNRLSALNVATDAFVIAIDSSDTVYFDLSKATLSGNQLIIPVEIMTGEPINAVDFSFRYNHAELDYDTISNLVFYLQGLAYYNPSDSAVRFTSSSLTPVGVASTLVEMNFNLLGSQINASDFYDVCGFLNGIKCSAVFLNQLNVGIGHVNNNNENLRVYPNPANDLITIQSVIAGEYILTDIRGQQIMTFLLPEGNEKLTLDVTPLNSGIYFIRSVDGKLPASKISVVR